MKRLYLFIFLVLFLSKGTAYSQDAFTWEDCVEKAKKNNPDLVSASEKVRQARMDKIIDISAALPDISTSLSGKSAKAASTKVTTDTYAYSVTGEQLVFDGFKTLHNISSSSKTLNAQEYDYAVTSSNIRLNLRSAFAELLKAQELTTLTKEIADRRKQNLELVKLRYEGGREHKGSLLTADADLANADYEVRQAERSITLSQRDLSKEMGLERFDPMRVEGEFSAREEHDSKPDIEGLADTTPFLRELIAKKEAARSDLKSEQADFFPTVYVNGTVGKTNDEWPPENDNWTYGVTVSLPIFEGGSRFADVSKARAKLRQLESDERSGRDTVLLTLEDTWKDLQDSIENVSVRKKFLEAAEERARITTTQYETGLTSFDDWIIIEDNLVNSKKSYLNARATMLIAEAYWIQAIGGTLEYD